MTSTRSSGGSRHRRPGSRRGIAQWSPLILTAVIVVLAAATPRDVAVSRLMPVAPALASAVWSVGATVVLGLFALVLTLIVEFVLHVPGTTFTAAAVVAVTAAAAYASHVRLQRERTLSQVRAVAVAAQSVVLRPLPRRLGPVGIETLYLAAVQEARVGGDFFEAVETCHGVRLLLGDVRGKGLSAVGVASAVTNSFRDAAHDAPDLGALARRLDTALSRYAELLPEGANAAEGFATAILAQIPRGEGPAELLNCGHPPPLLLRADGRAGGGGTSGGGADGDGSGVEPGAVRVLDPTLPSPPINMAALIGGGYTVDTVALVPGDRLLFYTDGVTETRDRSGAFFPLPAWARTRYAASPRALLDQLHEGLVQFSGGALDDDIAALVVRYDPAPVVPDGVGG